MPSACSALALSALTVCACLAEGITLPPLNGTISGDLSPLGPAQPQLRWTATTRSSAGDQRSFSLVIDGPGARLNAAGQIATSDGKGTWKIGSAHMDLRTWFAAVAAKYFPSAARVEVLGQISADGEGAIDSAELSGVLRFQVVDASLSDATNGWSAEGLSASLLLPDPLKWATAPKQELRFRSFNAGDLSLKNGYVAFQIESTKRIRIDGARLEGLGGSVVASGFVLDLEKSEMEAILHLNGVDLSALQRYFPKAIVAAQGRVDGQFVLRWTAKDGVQVGDGNLQLRSGDAANLRLSAAQGFLSGHVPERINLLPDWMGRIARNVSQAFKAHETLEQIESGREMLVVDSLQIELHGASPARDAGALVKIVAHPTRVDVVKVVRLNVTLNGPITDLLRYGLRGQLSLGSE